MRPSLLTTLALCACKLHGVPELPPDRDPAQAAAPVPAYEPPADLLSGAIFYPVDAPAPAKGGAHAGHGGAAPGALPADEPEKAPPEKAPKSGGHEGHGGMTMPMPEPPKGSPK